MDSVLRLAGIVPNSITDDPGLRFAVFVQGCRHACPGCHNPQTHDPAGGVSHTVQALAAQLCADPLVSGLSLSGGEPFDQAAACADLANLAHAAHLTVWCWTGYRFEDLADHGTPDQRALLETVDVLVDGPFLLEQRTLALPWRGSGNQRLIRVPETLADGTIHLW